jgi:hypothetical protein
VTDNDESHCLGVVGPARKVAVCLHLPKARAMEHVLELSSRIEPMTEAERPRHDVAEKNPLVLNATPVVDDLVPMHDDSIGQVARGRRGEHASEHLLPEDVEYERATGSETRRDIREDLLIVGIVAKESE